MNLLGVASFMQRHYNLEGIFFSGASGGAWAALLLASNEDLEAALATLIEEAPKCCIGRTLCGAYGVYDVGMSMVYNIIFKGKDLPPIINGRLAIPVTRLTWKFLNCSLVPLISIGVPIPYPYLKDEVISHFNSNEDIFQCIVASALIPFALNGRPFVSYRDWWICVDAGMTNIYFYIFYIIHCSSFIYHYF